MTVFKSFFCCLLLMSYTLQTTSYGSNMDTNVHNISLNKVGIIIGSTRPTRIGHQVAQWVLKEVSQTNELEFKLIDLAVWNLPMFNEPNAPAQNRYVHLHTQQWSQEIESYQAYIIITPEYNGGYPASLKNALDYLYKEWTGKPVIIVSYGYGGGIRAAHQLKEVLKGGLKMNPTLTMPALSLKKDMFDETGKLKNINQQFAIYSSQLKDSVEELKKALF